MISFTLSIIALIIGYFLYGRFVERVFGPDNRTTPAVAKADGVDYMVLPQLAGVYDPVSEYRRMPHRGLRMVRGMVQEGEPKVRRSHS